MSFLGENIYKAENENILAVTFKQGLLVKVQKNLECAQNRRGFPSRTSIYASCVAKIFLKKTLTAPTRAT